MLNLQTPALDIVIRTFVVYAAILIGLRITGKRELGQLTIFDLALVLLISNAVQNAMLGPDNSLLGGLIAAATLLVADQVVVRLGLRSARLRKVLQGSPTLLVLHGQVLHDHLRREGLDEETLEAAVREHGVEDLSDVEMAVLELDGSISIVPVGQVIKRTRRLRKSVKHDD